MALRDIMVGLEKKAKSVALVAGLAASSLLFSGCEIPGGFETASGIVLSGLGAQRDNASAVVMGQGLTQYGSAVAGRSQVNVNAGASGVIDLSISQGVRVTPYPYRTAGYFGVGGQPDSTRGEYIINDIDYAPYNTWGSQLQSVLWEDANGNGVLDSEYEIKEFKNIFFEGEKIGFRLKSRLPWNSDYTYRVLDSREVVVHTSSARINKYVYGINMPTQKNLITLQNFLPGEYNLIFDNRMGLKCDCPFVIKKKN
jgi:hypothetical protein